MSPVRALLENFLKDIWIKVFYFFVRKANIAKEL